MHLDPEGCSECTAILCETCAENVSECPVCRCSKSKISKNVFLKKAIALLVIECEDGCGEKFEFIDKDAHMKKCKALLDPEGFEYG